MPVMEVTLQQSYAGQQIINRWNYLASGVPAAVSFSFALASALGAIESAGVYPVTGMMWRIALMQDDGVAFTQLTVKDVYSVDDFYQVPFVVPLVGQLVGTGASPAIAVGYRTNRTRLDIRRGTKRFVGPTEEVLSANGNLEASYLAGQVASVASVMSSQLEYDDEGNTLTFAPVVVGKEKYVPTPEFPDRFAYRYYPTEAEQLDHIMASILWQAYPQVRTQASRQYGRGR